MNKRHSSINNTLQGTAGTLSAQVLVGVYCYINFTYLCLYICFVTSAIVVMLIYYSGRRQCLRFGEAFLKVNKDNRFAAIF